jgi:hypothetical protein
MESARYYERGVDSTADAAASARLYSQLAAEWIGNGHAINRHAIADLVIDLLRKLRGETKCH